MNRIIIGDEARALIKKGVDEVANVVKVTYGCKGRNVILGRPHMLPYISKDGVTVAKEALLDNDIENIGAFLVKQVAAKTNDVVSDGTTTATILAQAIVNEASNLVANGHNPIYIKKGIDKAVEFSKKELDKYSKKIKNNSELVNIATISANGDRLIGKDIASIFRKVGKDGSIKVEEGLSPKTIVEYTAGYEIDNGFLNWGFINNHEKYQVEYEDAYVLIYEGYLEEMSELDATIHSIYDNITKDIPPLLIISDNIDTQVLNKLIAFNQQGKKILPIKSPSFGSKRSQVLEDIVSVVGGTVYSKERGKLLNTVDISGLGKVKKLICNSEKTSLIGGQGLNKSTREALIREQIKTLKNKKDKDFAKERLAKLTGGVVVISVGGYSSVEIKEKIDRVDDALGATRASLEEGYVSGGGITYLKLSKALESLKLNDLSEQEGVNILKKSLEYPFIQLLSNGGLDASLYINSLEEGFGVNMVTEEVVNMIDFGIIDPVKVTKTALENAASIASTFLTTGGIIWRDEEIISTKSEF